MQKAINGSIKRIFIFDPCFGGLTGHWENYCRRFYDEMKKHCSHVKVFGQKKTISSMIKGITFKPVFTTTPFIEMANLDALYKQSNIYINDFTTIDVSQFSNGDLLVFHSIYPQIFMAIIEWANKKLAHIDIVLAILFQFPPSETKAELNSILGKLTKFLSNFPSANSANNNLDWIINDNVRFYQAAAKKLIESKRQYILFANTDILSKNYSHLLGYDVYTLPMPGPKRDLTNNLSEKSLKNIRPKIKFGYFGHSSFDKGGQFLRYLVENIPVYYADVEFVLHINPNPETEEHLKYFQNRKIPNTTCYYGHLEPNKLMSLMNEVDIILMPYSKYKYANTPSAVFTEGMPLQKVFIIPSDTWIHREAKKYRAGFVSFNRFNQVSILKACLKAILDFHELQTKNKTAALRFYQEHNIENCVNVFLKHIDDKCNETKISEIDNNLICDAGSY